MKFDQKTIVTLLIGIVIGGVGIGLIDANRPKPLFSSANRPIRTWMPVSIGCGEWSFDTGGRQRDANGNVTYILCEMMFNASGEAKPGVQ